MILLLLNRKLIFKKYINVCSKAHIISDFRNQKKKKVFILVLMGVKINQIQRKEDYVINTILDIDAFATQFMIGTNG